MKHRGFIKVTDEAMARLLHLAPGTEVIGIQQDLETGSYRIFLEGPRLPLNHKGEPVMCVPHGEVSEFEG